MKRDPWYIVVEIAEKCNVTSCIGEKFYFKNITDAKRFCDVVSKKFKVIQSKLKHGGYEVKVEDLIK